MAKKEISNERWEQIQTELGKADAAVKRVPIASIEVDTDSLRKGKILVGGTAVPVSPQFFGKMAQMLKLSSSLTKQMFKLGDHKMAAALINGLKEYAAKNKKDSEVVLIANVKNMQVIDICDPKRFKRASNGTIFDITSRIMNDNPNLILESVDFNPTTGAAKINILNNQEIGFAKAGKDEFFKFGFSILQGTKDTIVESYNQRLTCTNGMGFSLGGGSGSGGSGGGLGFGGGAGLGGFDKGLDFSDKFRLGGTSGEDINMFLQKIDNMNKAGFVNPRFENAINRAVDTKASLYEIEQAFRLSTRKIDELDPDLKKSYHSAVARNYFHAHGDTMARITKKGTDPAKLLDQHKKFIKTGMSVWDVINSMTFLGSNNSGIPLENQHELKYQAGQLFAKVNKEGYDLEFSKYANL